MQINESSQVEQVYAWAIQLFPENILFNRSGIPIIT
jgi:hypothetical protein